MSTVTFTPFVVQSRKRADGTTPVKIRVTYKRKSRWIATNLVATAQDLTRSGKLKNQYLKARADALVHELQQLAGTLSPFDAMAMDVDGVLEFLKSGRAAQAFHLDFLAFGRKVASAQTESGKKIYNVALNAFGRYLGTQGRTDIDINEITAAQVREFVAFVDAEPKATKRRAETKTPAKPKRRGVMSYRYVTVLRSVFRSARDTFNDEDSGRIAIPRTPFDTVRPREGVHAGQRNLGPDIIQRMIDADPVRPAVRFALDVFLVSFATMGANLADLYAAAPPVNGVWRYERKKTAERRADRARMQLTVQPEIEPILDRLRAKDGLHWLNLFRMGKDASAVGYKVNRGLKIWAEGEGVEAFTLYAARHSWASIARSAAVGVDKATVDDCLNHVTMSVADIYIAKDYSVFDAANRKVLDLFTWAQ